MATLTKLEFMKRCFKWVAIVTMSLTALVCLFYVVIGGHKVEATMFGEIAKWLFMGLGITMIFEVFTYVLGQLVYDFYYRKKHDVPYDGEA